MSDKLSSPRQVNAVFQNNRIKLGLLEQALTYSQISRPSAQIEDYLTLLDGITIELKNSLKSLNPGASSADYAACLGNVLAEKSGFTGDLDSYDDLQNADLMSVIDRRKGLPVALGIIYIHVGRQVQWKMEGLNFPNHFLLQATILNERNIIDPFNGGRLLSQKDFPDFVEDNIGDSRKFDVRSIGTVSDQEILLRLQNNIKLRLLQKSEFSKAASVIERMTALAPDQLELLREGGIVNAKIGNLKKATEQLRSYLDKIKPNHPAFQQTSIFLENLQNRLN